MIASTITMETTNILVIEQCHCQPVNHDGEQEEVEENISILRRS